VNGYLRGAFPHWAVVGAFGDNLDNSARAAARTVDLDEDTLSLYRNLGIYINYNGYGAALEDLHFHPAELYRLMLPYTEPRHFVSEAAQHYQHLEAGYRDDMDRADALQPAWSDDSAALFVLPEAAWARRVSGVFSNSLANASPGRAHAVFTEKRNGNFLVSVRAPLDDKRDADTLCRQFETGGGRAAAAGINDLPQDQLDRFIDALRAIYG
jgi:hypothetical protein